MLHSTLWYVSNENNKYFQVRQKVSAVGYAVESI